MQKALPTLPPTNPAPPGRSFPKFAQASEQLGGTDVLPPFSNFHLCFSSRPLLPQLPLPAAPFISLGFVLCVCVLGNKIFFKTYLY